MDAHRLVFIGGLHRSGTTPLARCLATHPEISGFSGTAATEDEGQHLQSVYPAAAEHGGPGRFAFAPAAHLTEDSPLAEKKSAGLLMEQWRPHWDLSRPVLVEKSPPNLVMTRFLQALFPDAYFLVVVRHPVVVTLSTRKWAKRMPLRRLMAHWFAAHDTFSADAPHLRRLHVVKYEDLVTRPETVLAGIHSFLDLDYPISAETLQGHRSSSYENQWEEWRGSRRRTKLEQVFEGRARHYGYSMRDLDLVEPFPAID